MPFRIAFFTDTFFPEVNGVTTYFKIILDELLKKDYYITVYTNSKAENPFNNSKIEVINLSSLDIASYNGSYLCIPNPLRLDKLLNTHKPAIIHAHVPSLLAFVAAHLAKSKKIPTIATFHGFLDMYYYYFSVVKLLNLDKTFKKISNGNFINKSLESLKKANSLPSSKYQVAKKEFIWGLLKVVYNGFDFVVSPSKLSMDIINKRGLKCIYIPHGIDIGTFNIKKDYNRTNRILTVGRLGFEKRLDVLLKAFKLVIKNNPNARLTSVGDGPAREYLVQLAKNLGISNQVNFERTVERRKLQSYFERHDFFATASDSETFGYVTAEAMSAGLPIVGINAQGTADLVKSGINGYLVRPNNIKQFATAMEKLLSREADLKKMGYESFKLVQNFSVKKSVDAHINLYETAIKRKNN